MSFVENKSSQPINIPRSRNFNNEQNFRYISLKQYTNYNCELPMYSNSPQKPCKTITVKEYIYSSDRFGPDTPFSKTPPNKESFKRMYMEMFANIQLNYMSPKD